MVRFSDAYRAEMDVLAAIMEERCVLLHDAHVGATPLYGAYKGWCAAAGENPETQTRFGTMLGDRSLAAGRDPKTRRKVWYGVGLLADDGPDDGDGGGAGPEKTLPAVSVRNGRNSPKRLKPYLPARPTKSPAKNNRFAPPLTVSQGGG